MVYYLNGSKRQQMIGWHFGGMENYVMKCLKSSKEKQPQKPFMRYDVNYTDNHFQNEIETYVYIYVGKHEFVTIYTDDDFDNNGLLKKKTVMARDMKQNTSFVSYWRT